MSNLTFGPVVLGGNTFGWTANAEESFVVLDAFVDRGGVATDTADVYSAWVPGNVGGESETIIGQWLHSRGGRDRVQIATKVAKAEPRRGLGARGDYRGRRGLPAPPADGLSRPLLRP